MRVVAGVRASGQVVGASIGAIVPFTVVVHI